MGEFEEMGQWMNIGKLDLKILTNGWTQGNGLVDELAWVTQHPVVHHPKNHVMGSHGWDENVPQGLITWSILFFFYFYFSQLYIFP
jgi:hypothetical protein